MADLEKFLFDMFHIPCII